MNTGLMDGRKRRVAAAVKRAGADALLVTDAADVRYLCEFTGSNAALLLKGTRATMFTDGRYTGQAAAEVDGAAVRIVDRSVGLAACEFAVESGVVRCGFDGARTTVAGLESLRAGLAAKVRRDMSAGLRWSGLGGGAGISS